eukprot:185042-Hanusia_phi.AAC.2
MEKGDGYNHGMGGKQCYSGAEIEREEGGRDQRKSRRWVLLVVTYPADSQKNGLGQGEGGGGSWWPVEEEEEAEEVD